MDLLSAIEVTFWIWSSSTGISNLHQFASQSNLSKACGVILVHRRSSPNSRRENRPQTVDRPGGRTLPDAGRYRGDESTRRRPSGGATV